MCYLDTYNCTITCLNSGLNVTSAMNGTIRSQNLDGVSCHVTGCELVSHYSEGAYTRIFDMPFMEFNLYAVGFLISCIVVALAACYYILPDKKEE